VAVDQLTACTGLRPSGQADLCALDLLRRRSRRCYPAPAKFTSSWPAWVTSTWPRPASWSCWLPARRGRTRSCTVPRWSCSGWSSCARPR